MRPARIDSLLPLPLDRSEQVLALPDDTERLAFGNDVYSIEFSDRSTFRPYGHRYEFYLQDAVEDVPEYLVDWPNFTSCVPARSPVQPTRMT